MKTAQEYLDLLLSLAASLTLADGLGDVGNDLGFALEQIGIENDWHDMDELAEILHSMGVKTLQGTDVGGLTEDDEEDD